MGINHGCGQRENAFARFCFASLVTTGRHDSNGITGAGRGAIDAISLRKIKALRFSSEEPFCAGAFMKEKQVGLLAIGQKDRIAMALLE